jgi:hypothetical protein
MLPEPHILDFLGMGGLCETFDGRLAQALACDNGFKSVGFVGLGRGDHALSPSPQLCLK